VRGLSNTRAILVQQRPGRFADPERDEEFRRLAESADCDVCGELRVQGAEPHPATLLGEGKLEELVSLIEAQQAGLVLVDHELTPVQERNLAKRLGRPVRDRTGLILDIFARRARSHEGKLQVELARLEHQATRLVRGWTHLERQKGGIGLRGGPGETQLEVDRRGLSARIVALRRRLDRIEAQRSLRRRSRRRVPIPTVSLVGYTNAGKSSLFNRVTGAGVYAADKLFATLDPTMRRVELPGFGQAVLSDTVGFLRDLPHGLIEAFHATLEEVAASSLLLHVVDVSHPDREECMTQVLRVLEEIGAADLPVITVFNKIDLTQARPAAERDPQGRINRVWVSARTGAGVAELLAAMGARLGDDRRERRLKLSPAAGGLRARLYAGAQVVRERVLDDGSFLMTVRLSDSEYRRFHAQRRSAA
jgi:GTP-binding protein HflX